MNTRTCSSTVTFRRPFILSGLDGMQPPGTYNVEIQEGLLDTMTTCAYRRISTSIELHGQPAGIGRTATIDPQELADALARDAEESVRLVTLAEPHVIRRANVDWRSGTTAGDASDAGRHWAIYKDANPAAAMKSKMSNAGAWGRWISLNANELTWIFLVSGALLLAKLVR